VTIKRTLILGVIFLVTGLSLNIVETWYFGWNLRAESTVEAYADVITSIPFGIGLIMTTRALLTFKIKR